MESIIKNERYLDFLPSNDFEQLQQGALQHRKFSRIVFKVLSVSEKEIRIETRQSKNPNGNHFDQKILIERTKELFGRFLGTEWKINVVPVVYKESAAEQVTPAYVRHYMTELKIKAKDISSDTGIDKTNISTWVNGEREMSQSIKAMFYYYFAFKQVELNKNKIP